LRPDQWIDTGLLSNGIIRERLSTIMDAQVMRGLFNSMIESPTTPHHFVMSVNGLQYRSLAQQLQERTNAGLGENTYAPRWALYIDGQVAMSSMRATHMVELAFPLWDQPPHVTSANTDLQTASVFHDPREEYGPPHNLSVSNIITESMRLYVGVEGYPQHRWVVKTPHMVDPSETDGIDDVKIRLLRTRNPIMNTHPFNGAVEMIAVHKHAFTKQEAVAHHSAGLPNRPPRITTGLTDLSVLEDVCGALDLTADDDDVARYGKIQNVTWNVLSTMYPIYTNNNCTTQASIDETTTYSALYYKGPFNFYGPYGSMVVRAYDGQAFSRQRNIALMISPVNDAYMLHNATATIEPLGVANFTIIGTSPDTQMQATNGFRLKIVSLPAHGNLFDGDPNAGEVASGPPLAVGSITTDNVIYYQSLESMLVASTIAHTDLFLLTGVASRSDAESHIVGGVEVNVLSGLLPQTTTAVVTEDDNSFVTLRAFYTGLTLNVTFQIVGTNLVSLYQADGSPIVGASPGTPVQLTGPVIECADDSNYKCTTLSVRTAQDLTGRRLQTVFASPATFTYEVIAEGVISEPATVSISIVSVLDPITDFVCATAHNFSRFTSTVTYPLLNNVNFSDTPGTGEYMYVSITSRSYEFDVSATTLQGPADVHPPLASQFQTLGYQAYDMVGFCPSVCTTMSSSSTNAQYGLRCGTCLADTIDSTGVTSFRAVMETSLVKQVLDSVKISMQTQGYIPSYDGFINVELYKFDNETSGFFNQCNVALFAEEEAYFEMYAEAGQCLFHSSIGLLERIIGLAACTWFYWNGPIFWWIRTGTLTGGIVTRVLVAVWFTGISALFVLCCIFCVVCASQAFVRYVLATMRKLNTFLDQEENKDRGDRVEASFPQVVCLYGTFYGCFCCCPSWCLPRRENDTNGFQRLQYFAWAYLTFKLIPALRPRGEPPGPSWSEWTWDYFSWFLCRGFGLVPSMKSWESRHHADAQKLKQQRANASARRKGKEPPFKEQENLINNLPAATKKFPDVKPTWREWLWEQLSRLLCYGFGQVETLKPWSKRKEERKANSENQKIRVSL
jgi:hypothetical protein